jgi:hypothetical protein
VTTWGQVQEMLDSWFGKYVSEGWAVLTPEWAKKTTGLTPTGLSLYALGQQFAQWTGEANPFPNAPVPTPGPDQPPPVDPGQGASFPVEWTPALVARLQVLAGKKKETVGQYTNDRLTTLTKAK